MAKLIASPTPIATVGTVPKRSDEFVGLVNTGDSKLSITVMHSPPGWEGIGRIAKYHEYKVVFKGLLRVVTPDDEIDVEAGQALHVEPGEWARYSTPSAEGAEYVTVCTPSYSRADVKRDE